ncbi:hypothetical protein, partial [Sphingomonas hominis]|uniref:hypothetical protein n=1 Tax=Sphingomonas hominis TaxID=2741495 RepID=UPI001CB6BA69
TTGMRGPFSTPITPLPGSFFHADPQFAAAKMTVGAPTGTPPWTLTAARAEVLLPAQADDRMSDARTLMEMIDAELPSGGKALLAYATFTFETERLHVAWEVTRHFVKRHIVDTFEVATLLIQHAPHRAGSANTPHVHALIAGPRRVTGLGLAEWVPQLAGDKAHALIRNAFLEFHAAWPAG